MGPYTIADCCMYFCIVKLDLVKLKWFVGKKKQKICCNMGQNVMEYYYDMWVVAAHDHHISPKRTQNKFVFFCIVFKKLFTMHFLKYNNEN